MVIILDESWGSPLNDGLCSEWIKGSASRFEPRTSERQELLSMTMNEALEIKNRLQNTVTHNARQTLAKWMYGGGYTVFAHGKLHACPPLEPFRLGK